MGDLGLGFTNPGEIVDGVFFFSAAGLLVGGGVADGFGVGSGALPAGLVLDEGVDDATDVVAGFDAFALSAPFRAVLNWAPPPAPALALGPPTWFPPLAPWTPRGPLTPSV